MDLLLQNLNVTDVISTVASMLDHDTEHEDEVHDSDNQVFQTARTIVNYAGILITMFSMGCIIKIEEFSQKESHIPKSVIIGLTYQSLVQPLVGYVVAQVLHLQVFDALALVLFSCCPISPYSAVLAYYANGAVIVGLCLSMFATALSIGLMPYWFSLYSSLWSDEYHVVATPTDIFLTEALIFLPVTVGVLFKKYAGVKQGRIVAGILSFAFIITVIADPVLHDAYQPQHYHVEWRVWLAAFLVPFIGFLVTLTLTQLFNLPREACSAISLACCTPSWFLAIQLANQYFPEYGGTHESIITFLAVATITTPVQGIVWAFGCRVFAKFWQVFHQQCCKKKEDTYDYYDTDDDFDDQYTKSDRPKIILN